MKTATVVSSSGMPLITVLLMTLQVCLGQKTDLPQPIALYPLNKQYGTQDISSNKNPGGIASGVHLAPGIYGQPAGSYHFTGSPTSFIVFPNSGGLDARYSLTLLAWIYPENPAGPIFNYMGHGRGVHLWLQSPNKISAKFEMRHSSVPFALQSDRLRLKSWNFVAASYDESTGAAKLWIDGVEVSSLSLGRYELETRGDVRMGAVVKEPHFFKGRISCMQVYDKSLSKQEIDDVRDRCPIQGQSRHIGCYADKSPPAIASLEGKDPVLDGDPRTRKDAKEKCTRVALKFGYMYYAIQDGGHCLSSLSAQDTYDKYGLSTDCGDNKGGKMASDVYEIIMSRGQTCWNGWVSNQNACYRLYDEHKTWSESQSACEAQMGSLAKLDSEDKSYFVFLNVIKPVLRNLNVWIGLSRDSEGIFHWSDGTLLEYSNWGPDKPDKTQGNRKNCTEMNGYTGLWEDEEFDHTHPFVCGRAIPAMPQDLRIHLMDNHSALVFWAFTGHSRQLRTSYYVEYGVKSKENFQLKIVSNQNITSLTGLQSNAEYQVRVRAVNAAGGGVWSHYKTFSTGKMFPPYIHPLPSVKTQLPGETLEINCTAQGGPEPTITWYKGKAFIQEGQTLVIRNLSADDHGVYTCRASNGIDPDDIQSLAVTSLVPPVITNLWGAGTEEDIFIDKGERLTLNCEIDNMTEATVSWYKDGEPLGGQLYTWVSNSGIGLTEITGAHFGSYECQASNSLGMASRKIKVTNAYQITASKVAIGCLAVLCVVLLVVVAVETWLLMRSRRRAKFTDKDQTDNERPLKPQGPRPSDSDFMVTEVKATGSPGIMSRGSNSSYTPLKTVSSNGGTSTFKPNATQVSV